MLHHLRWLSLKLGMRRVRYYEILPNSYNVSGVLFFRFVRLWYIVTEGILVTNWTLGTQVDGDILPQFWARTFLNCVGRCCLSPVFIADSPKHLGYIATSNSNSPVLAPDPTHWDVHSFKTPGIVMSGPPTDLFWHFDRVVCTKFFLLWWPRGKGG